MKRIVTRVILSMVLGSMALFAVASCATPKPYRPVDKDGISSRADRDMGELERSTKD